MDEIEKQQLIIELKGFYKELKSYIKILERNKELSVNQKRYRDSLRERLVGKTAKFKDRITELTDKRYYTQFGATHDIWADGLNPVGYIPSSLTGLSFCIDATNEAINKLESTSGKAEVIIDVKKDSSTLLNEIFSASLESPDGVDALKFRADNEQFLTEIDRLVARGFIIRSGNRYSIQPLALAQLAQQNLEAQNMIYRCGLIFDFLRGAYKANQRRKVTISGVSKGTNLSEGDVRAALQIIIQTPILGAHSSDLTAEDAFIEPYEGILKFQSFDDILQEMREQFEPRSSQYSEAQAIPPKTPKYPVEQGILFSASQTNWKAITKEFGITKNAFGRKINFVSDKFRRNIIFRDVEHAFLLASSGFSKPAVILAGGVIEELLRLYLEHKGISPIPNSFDGYIKTCEQNRLLKSGISRLSDSARHFRNLVHISNEQAKRDTISKSKAKGAVSSIFTIANDF